MYYPSFDQVRELAKDANLVPVYREVLADLETPVSAYLKVARGRYSFLLESVEGGERIARYSFIGSEPYLVMRTGVAGGGNNPGVAASPEDAGRGGGIVADLGAIDPLVPIERELGRHTTASVDGLPRFHGGAVGYLSYDAVRHFERLPTPDDPGLGLPEAVFMLTDTLVVFDHRRHKMQIVSHVQAKDDLAMAYAEATRKIDRIVERLERPLEIPAAVAREKQVRPVESNLTEAQHADIVSRSKEYIVAGDIIQGVMAQRLRRETKAAPFDLYRAVRTVNPSPYMFYLDLDAFQLVGASPEMLVRVEGSSVSTNPIAGTRPRGASEEEDLLLEEELRSDEKERAEHIMLVDLGRNDVGRVSEPATVKVDQFMDVERYSHVMHLVSQVTGRLRDGVTAYDALRACFPAGTVSGAPKIRAMEIIAELEPDRRGPYAGAVGYFDFSGNMDTCIAIRTMVVKGGVAHVQAGGGIVYDSVPKAEYEETLHKAGALLRAIDEAEAMEQWMGPIQDRSDG